VRGDPGVDAGALRDLNFDSLISSYVDMPRFVRREWWAGEITAGLSDPGCTFLLLTAEQGAGKTALMAQLARDNPHWQRYFLRRDQQQPLADTSARAVFLRLGFQLATARPELFPPPGEIVVEQRIGTVSSSGRVTGIEVQKLLASPFRKVAFEAHQQITKAKGQVVGVHIGQWVADVEFVPISDLAAMALLDPLTLMLAEQDDEDEQDDEEVIVLLDAMDEAAGGSSEETILDWLAAAPDLPGNLKIVVTSRPNPQVDAFAARQCDRVRRLTFDPGDARVQGELRGYARNLAAAGPTRTALVKAGRTAEDFVRESLSRAEGNIGYLAAIGRTVDQAASQPEFQADLESLIVGRNLPARLRGLYTYFLRQLRARTSGREIGVEDPESGRRVYLDLWSEIYQPLLEVFATAFDDLGADELTGLTGTRASPSELNIALGRLAHLLDNDRGRYRFHHATIAEFLTDPVTARDPATVDLAVDAIAVYRRIGRNLARMVCGAEPALALPGLRRYALTFAPAYLMRASQGGTAEDSQPRDDLRGLLTDLAFTESKVGEIGVQAALADLAGAGQLLGGDDGAVRQIHSVLAGEAGDLQADQKGDPYPLGNSYFGNREGDFGRVDRFHAPWLTHAGFVLHQLLNGAISAGDTGLADTARRELLRRRLPHLELQWAVTALPPRIFDFGPRDGHLTARVITVSADGRWVLTQEKTVTWREDLASHLTVWDTETGERSTISMTTADINAIWAVTADGAIAVSGTSQGQITVWHLRDVPRGDLPVRREVLQQRQGKRSASRGITALALAGNGAWVAAADKTGDLRVWHLAAGTPGSRCLRGSENSMIVGMAVLSGDRGVGYVTRDGHVGIWELDGPPLIVGVALGGDGSIALSPDGQLAAVGSGSKVSVIDLRSPGDGKILTVPDSDLAWETDGGPVSLAILPGSLAMAGIYSNNPGLFGGMGQSIGSRIVVWEPGSGQVLADYALDRGWSRGCLASRAPRAFAAGSDGTLVGWRLDQAQHGQKPHAGTVTSVAVAEQGDRAVSVAGDEARVRIWHLGGVPSSEWLSRSDGPPGYGERCVALSADGTRAVSGSNGGTITVWELSTGHASVSGGGSGSWGNPRPDPLWVMAVAISADGRRMVSNRTREDELVLSDLADKTFIDRFKGFRLRHLAMTPDLRYGIGGGDQPAWWDLPEHRCTLLPTPTQGQAGVGPVEPVPVTAVAITPDGARGAVGYADGAVWLWELQDGPREAGQVSAHAMGVHGLAFLAGGTQFVSASGDRTVAVWETDTGRELARTAFPAPLRCLAASAEQVLVGDAVGGVHYCRWHGLTSG
jgi:WD40 repeat protein